MKRQGNPWVHVSFGRPGQGAGMLQTDRLQRRI